MHEFGKLDARAGLLNDVCVEVTLAFGRRGDKGAERGDKGGALRDAEGVF